MDPILQQQPTTKKAPTIITTLPEVTKEEIPKITQIAPNVVQIGNKNGLIVISLIMDWIRNLAVVVGFIIRPNPIWVLQRLEPL